MRSSFIQHIKHKSIKFPIFPITYFSIRMSYFSPKISSFSFLTFVHNVLIKRVTSFQNCFKYGQDKTFKNFIMHLFHSALYNKTLH